MNRSYISLDFKYVYTEVSKKKIQVLTESIYTHTHAYTWMLKIKTVMIDNIGNHTNTQGRIQDLWLGGRK
jgi:hypothetical protein